MIEFRENETMVEFQPFLVYIDNPGKIPIKFSHFAVPKTNHKHNFRGIADIKVEGEGEITLRVYITQLERTNKAILKGLKKNNNGWGWVPLCSVSDFTASDNRPPWVGYLTTTLTKGDPPIAVG